MNGGWGRDIGGQCVDVERRDGWGKKVHAGRDAPGLIAGAGCGGADGRAPHGSRTRHAGPTEHQRSGGDRTKAHDVPAIRAGLRSAVPRRCSVARVLSQRLPKTGFYFRVLILAGIHGITQFFVARPECGIKFGLLDSHGYRAPKSFGSLHWAIIPAFIARSPPSSRRGGSNRVTYHSRGEAGGAVDPDSVECPHRAEETAPVPMSVRHARLFRRRP